MKKITMLLLSMVLCTFSACHRATDPILNPSVTWQEYKVSDEQLYDCITHALKGRGWIVEKTDKGYVQASIIVRNKHKAVIDINYSPTSVSISYVSSYNLNFKDKGENGKFIHQNYNLWVRLLASDIKKLIKFYNGGQE